jgi:hypothetical protein
MRIAKSFAFYLFISAITASSFLACSKDNDDKSSTFTWAYDGVSYTSKLDSAYVSSLPFSPIIMATTGNSLFAPSAELQIRLASFNPGTFIFPGGNNAVQFTDPQGFSHNDVNGTLNLTDNSNGLSGNFSIGLSSGKTITGSFSSVPVKQ